MATDSQKFNKDSTLGDLHLDKTLTPSDPVTDKYSPEGGESKGGDSPVVENSEPVSVTQKKMKRAERFGVPVQFSEEEKRNSRAERFGTASGTVSKDAVTNSEDLKRKARAERFGLPAQPTPADEDAKKKARLAKFSLAPKTDAIEEDKRKARAARFSEAKVTSLSHVNGEGNIELKAAIAGKASGGA